MALEIERKFLVADDSYKSLATSSSRIMQGYILSGNGRTVRVRLREHTGFLTIKGPSQGNGLARYEFEKEISEEEALSLFTLCEPGRIDKRRWLIPAGDGHTYEVDEFAGDNKGLVIAEIELGSEDEPFLRAPFLGREVTGIPRYYNASLRRHPYKTWTEEEITAETQ